jgi:hypothetical protein
LIGFAADMLSGGEEVLVHAAQGALLLPAAAFWHDPVIRHHPECRGAEQAYYQVHLKGAEVMREIAKDTGWVGGAGGKRGREFA